MSSAKTQDDGTKPETAADRRAERLATSKEVLRTAAKIHEVVKYPDPILARRGERVTEFTPELAQLVEEMFDSMYAAQGIGLAAPQIGISKQITVIDVSFKERPEDKLVLINPEVLDREGKQVEEEGCLSLPEIRAKVERAEWVKVRAQNEKGEFFEVEGEELLARALLHEIDHLHGVLFIDRISRLKRDLILRRIKKLQKNGEW
jgi:peptide deformylase